MITFDMNGDIMIVGEFFAESITRCRKNGYGGSRDFANEYI